MRTRSRDERGIAASIEQPGPNLAEAAARRSHLYLSRDRCKRSLAGRSGWASALLCSTAVRDARSPCSASNYGTGILERVNVLLFNSLPPLLNMAGMDLC